MSIMLGDETQSPKREDGSATQDPPAILGERVGNTIHTHTLSEEMASMMKQMKELQCRYDELMSKNTSGVQLLSSSPSVDIDVDPTANGASDDKTTQLNQLTTESSLPGNGVDKNAVNTIIQDNDQPEETSALKEVPLERAVVPEIRYTSWEGFKNIILEDRKEYAIDVLLGPAKFYWQRQVDSRRDKKRNAQTQRQPDQFEEEEGGSQEILEDLLRSQKEMPERIRINSKHILAILKELAPEHFGSQDLKPTVFLRPYKLFSTQDTDIRQYWTDLKLRVSESKASLRHDTSDHQLGDRTESEKHANSAWDTVYRYEHGSSNATGEADASSSQAKDASTTSVDALHDLGCLLTFMDQYVSPIIEAYASDSIQQVRFRDIWHLYRPGDEMVCLQDLYVFKSKAVGFTAAEGSKTSDPSLWRVLQVSSGRPVLCSPHHREDSQSQSSVRAPAVKCNTFKVLAYMLGYDGWKFGPIYHTFEIKPFEGLRAVDNLELIPSRLYSTIQTLRGRLQRRGLKFMTTTAPSHFIYTGHTLRHHPGGRPCPLVRRTHHMDSSVIVDLKEAYRSNPNWVLSLAIPEAMGGSGSEVMEDFHVSYWKDKDRKQLHVEIPDSIHDDTDIDEMAMVDFITKDGFLSSFQNKLSDEDVDGSNFGDAELVLLPDRVVAFDLHSRNYVIIGLDGLQEVEVKAEGWGDLKLPRGHKKMVQAQVEMHFREKGTRQKYPGKQGDLVRGKGQGLIILLHGAPGTGKTSTAECVAEFLRRPLYPITCGDLGITAQQVEETLTEIFARAEAWDCVLLLDEADVFLAQRTRTDLKRNAIVSVFLRVLEYYKGILFLTTNRVGAFDEAFKSRIHLHLYYPILNKDQTMSIWQMNLDRLRRQRGESMQVDNDTILQYAEAHFDYHKQKNTRWNGRQIHNAFQTAASLAEYEALESNKQLITLEVAHFKTVADASHQFDRYIAETIGGSDADRALNDRDRADKFRWPAFQKDVDMYSRQTPGVGGMYQYPFRQWADHDSQMPFPPSSHRQSHFDTGDFEEFQRQKYFRQVPGGLNTMTASPSAKPWPRPEDDDGEDMFGPHRVVKDGPERSWNATSLHAHPLQSDPRNSKPSDAPRF